MKKVLSVSVMAALLCFVTSALAVEKAAWTGWIADESCAKDYAKASTAAHKGCAQSCLKRGSKPALSTEKGFFLLDLGDAKAEDNLGFAVKVEGELNKETNTIKVSSIAKVDK